MAELRELEPKITPLHNIVDGIGKIIYELLNRVGILVTKAYATEQNGNDIHIHETKRTSHIRSFTYLRVQWSNSFLSKGSNARHGIAIIIQQNNNSLKRTHVRPAKLLPFNIDGDTGVPVLWYWS